MTGVQKDSLRQPAGLPARLEGGRGDEPDQRSAPAMRLMIDGRHPWRTIRKPDLVFVFAGAAFNKSLETIAEALSGLTEAPTAEHLSELALSLDGHFAFAAASDNWMVAAVDRVRSIPLFYAKVSNVWVVDNRADGLRRAAGLGIGDVDSDAALAIAMAGYSIDRATLYRGLEMLAPGDCVCIRAGESPVRRRYFTYSPWRTRERPEAALKRELADVTLSVMEKHLRSLDGRMLVIPLSAGLDSRLVVSAARHLGYSNVRCFAYGRAGNFEADASRAIAERLEVPWQFAPCTILQQRRFFSNSDHAAYVEFADSCASVPFEQDMAPLQQLKASGFIPADAVISNGNSGDYISGNHIAPVLRILAQDLGKEQRRAQILAALEAKHFSLWQFLRTPRNVARIHSLLADSLASAGAVLGDAESDHGLYEYAEFQDRQCKYVISGQRIYEFLGHDWRLPLWDNDYLRFWESVPLHLKKDQVLYRTMLHEANWGGVWQDIPINRKTVRPLWLMPLRLAAKIAHAPLGRDQWHAFERRFFGYWIDATCNSACVPYRRVAGDRRGARLSVSWLTEQYLARHGIALDEFAQFES